MPTTTPATALSFRPLERKTLVLTAAPVDETGAAVTPSAMTWTLTDRAGDVVNSRSAVSVTPGTSVAIVLSGADLQIGPTFHDNRRELLIEYTYSSSAGSNLPGGYVVRFEIEPASGIS